MRAFKLSPKKYDELKECYRRFGCEDEYIDSFVGKVLNHDCGIDENVPYVAGWEIGFSMPEIRHTDKPDNATYAHWMKGGWNRLGTWESGIEPALTDETATKEQELPMYGYPNTFGLSYHYVRYMEACQRSISFKAVNPQDLLRDTKATQDSASKFLPVTFGAERYPEGLLVSASVGQLPPEPMSYVFIVDVSGSMSVRWVLVQLTMFAMFCMMRKGDSLSVVSFSDSSRVIARDINAGDMGAFLNAMHSVNANGGFAGHTNALTVAYSLFNDKKGKVFLFSDGMPDTDFMSEEVTNDFIAMQARFGISFNAVCFGSDSWTDEKLHKAVRAGCGQLNAVFSPKDIEQIISENRLSAPLNAEKICISPKISGKLWGGSDPSGKYPAFDGMTEGMKISALYQCQRPLSGEALHIKLSYLDRDDQPKEEIIEIVVKDADDESRLLLSAAIEHYKRIRDHDK